MFSDGSATPYSASLTLTDAEKAQAIAVIFYVGTACSNNSARRTLGVGLVQGNGKWCFTANAFANELPTIGVTINDEISRVLLCQKLREQVGEQCERYGFRKRLVPPLVCGNVLSLDEPYDRKRGNRFVWWYEIRSNKYMVVGIHDQWC